jgi:hypothetical protein
MDGMNAPLPATTTSQQDLTTAGQRRVNLLWEYTQASIALVVVVCTMVAGAWATFQGAGHELPNVLSMAFGTVVGFYFARTNHERIGGVGRKPPMQEYEGR